MFTPAVEQSADLCTVSLRSPSTPTETTTSSPGIDQGGLGGNRGVGGHSDEPGGLLRNIGSNNGNLIRGLIIFLSVFQHIFGMVPTFFLLFKWLG